MNAITIPPSVAILVALGLAAAGSVLCAEEPMKQPTTSNTPDPAGKIADLFQPVDLRKVKVGGEIARRINLTIEGDLLELNPDQHPQPSQKRGGRSGAGTGTGVLQTCWRTGPSAATVRRSEVGALWG